MNFSSITDAEFLNEPAYKWLVFLIAVSFFNYSWRGVIGYIK